MRLEPTRPLFRAVVILMGLSVAGLGLAALRKASLYYPNWWGGAVFVPLANTFGVILILGALFKPKIFR